MGTWATLERLGSPRPDLGERERENNLTLYVCVAFITRVHALLNPSCLSLSLSPVSVCNETRRRARKLTTTDYLEVARAPTLLRNTLYEGQTAPKTE